VRAAWFLLAALVLAEIAYPLTDGRPRASLVVATVLLGFAASVAHAWLTRGPRAAALLLLVTTAGGFAVEAVGRSTGYPFGAYDYTGALGPRLLGVPLVIPLAWTWMAWPAWIAAARLTNRPLPRVAIAGLGLAAWDLFLDPQMVQERYWQWDSTDPALPGVPGIPLTNYLGWFAVALTLMALLQTGLRHTNPPHPHPRADADLRTDADADLSMDADLRTDAGTGRLEAEPPLPRAETDASTDPGTSFARGDSAHPRAETDANANARATFARGDSPLPRADAAMYAMYLWTYASSILAHAVFLGLPASAAWGAAGMGLVAIPLAVRLWRS
jgi:putative membrane protein